MASITVRDLKNKETGLDIAIPTCKVNKKALSLSEDVVYNVLVVTVLPCFKLPSHKMTDVVQFMIPKVREDFEELRRNLMLKYSGIVLPPLPRETTIFSAGDTTQNKKSGMENFLKFLASVPTLASCKLLLEFLGAKTKKESEVHPTQKECDKEKIETFLEEEDLFLQNQSDIKGNNDDNEDFLNLGTSSQQTKIGLNVQLFGELELQGGIAEFEEGQFFVGDATSDSLTMQNKAIHIPHDEDDDLLNIEDNLQDLLILTNTEQKGKPIPPTKPTVPKKPQTKKPAVPEKPGKKSESESDALASLKTDDILKYIRDNAVDTDEVDLFS